MASSSSRPLKQAFLSCYERDVGEQFINDLRSKLTDNELTLFDKDSIDKTKFMDEEITLRAIQKSSLSIVVFSENYASSYWCLTELLEIWKCKQELDQKVKPIYYGVNPSDVLNQVSKFGDNLRRTSALNKDYKNTNWNQVLNDVANEDGFIFNNQFETLEFTSFSSNDESQPLLEPSSQASKSPWFNFLVFLSFITEITSFVSEILSEQLPIHERSFTILSFTMSILSVLICVTQVLYQVHNDKASFLWERPIPWFYYESHDKLKISGTHADRVLLFCAVGELIVWTINFTFNREELDRPIPTSIMPVLFSFGMVVSMFFKKKYMEKPIISANQDQNNMMV